MASSRDSILVALLFICCFKSSDHSEQVRFFPQTHSLFPVNPMISDDETCTGMQDQIAEMTKQLQQATAQNQQLDNNALGLRREISQLRAQLTTYSAAASAITGSYRTQLQGKTSQLLNTLDSDSSLVLKFIGLTRDINTLQKRLSRAANSTDVIIDVTALQEDLDRKRAELDQMSLEVKGKLQNSSLIFQIISLQNQIWDLEQLKQRGDNSPQLDKNISAQQAQLDKLFIQLRGQRGMPFIMLQLMSVQTKIAMTQRLIEVHIEESRTKKTTYQRQWTQLVELLKKKIVLLSSEEDNKDLTMEILNLQMDIERLKQLMSGSKTVVDTRLRELRSVLVELKKLQQELQLQLEEEEYGQAQLLMKILTIMKEARELEVSEQDSVMSQTNTLQNLLQTKEREYAKAQNEINELKKKLRLRVLVGSEVDENLIQVENDLEQQIAELNTNGETEVALVLTLVKLQNELKGLQDLIFLTDNQKRLSELQNLLEAKKSEINSKIGELERSATNHTQILKVFDLQRQIWNLEDKGSSEPIVKQREELQNRVKSLINEIHSGGNTQSILRLLNLLSQIDSLRKQLLDPSMLTPTQVNVLRSNLMLKETELQTFMEDRTERNPSTAHNILASINLLNKLRNLQQERQTGHGTPSSGVAVSPVVTEQLKAKERELAEYRTQITALQNLLEEKESICNAAQIEVGGLREQLKSRVVQQQQDQTRINSLQQQLNEMETHCSVIEEKLKGVQSDLDVKMKELQSKSGSVTTLALQVSTLTTQVEALKRQVQDSSSEVIIKDLEKTIKIKNNELANKTEELKARSSQAETFLRIVSLQVEIERLASVAETENDYANISALQNQLNSLVAEIQDESNENIRLVFKIIAHQDEIVRLRKQEQSQKQAKLKEIQGLENELEDIRGQIKEKTKLLISSDMTITNLTAQIMELHQQIQPLEDQISFLQEANANNTRDLEFRLHQSKTQLQDSQTQLQEVDKQNSDLITQITDLRKKLQTIRQDGNEAQRQSNKVLKQTIETQQRENRRLEDINRDLRQELELCSTRGGSSNCEEVKENLQQCNNDADRLIAQLHDIEVTMRELSGELEEKIKAYDTLQHEHQSLQNEMERLDEFVQDLQKKVKVDEDVIQANKIFFDPDTANPRLVLSSRNTEVTLSRTAQAVADNPGRFNVLLAVLGKGGYASGRNYWEVFVANKECYHLGMTSESAQRKGQMRVSPATGFWTIIMNRQGQYFAMDGSRVAIPMQTQPLVLGILIDYKKRQISFYDANARVHMYTFTNSEPFRGKIFPFFNFCVENVENPTPIVLLTPGSFDWLQ